MGNLKTLICIALCAASSTVYSADWLMHSYTPLSLAKQGHDVKVTSNEGGEYIIDTTGTDPYLLTNGINPVFDPLTPYVLAFQYKTKSDCPIFQILYQSNEGIGHINHSIEASEDWSWCFISLSETGRGLRKSIKWLRLDFGNQVNRQFQIRDCRLIKAKPDFDIEKLDHTPFTLNNKGNQVTIEKLTDESWEITSLGDDPYINTQGLTEILHPKSPYLIAFEYQAPADFGQFHFYFSDGEKGSHCNVDIIPTQEWTWLLHDFALEGMEKLKSLRFDFGQQANQVFKIRNLRAIKATPELRQRAIIGEGFDKIESFGISLQNTQPNPSATETVRHIDDKNISLTVSAYGHLDYDAQTKALSDKPYSQAAVPLAPRMVTGEGEHPENRTVIRILSPYQVCENQFLAFPPHIKGGVGVESGMGPDGKAFFAAWPLSANWQSIRIFSRHGGELAEIAIPREIGSPFSVAVGDWDPDKAGDEIAITSRYPGESATVIVYDYAGGKLSKLNISGTKGECALLSNRGESLILQDISAQSGYQLLPGNDKIDFADTPEGSQLFESVFPDREYNAGGSEPLVSTLYQLNEGSIDSTNAGKRENLFWFDPQEVHDGDRATWDPYPDGKYIKNSSYNFLGAAQYWSPLVKSGDIENKTYPEWVDEIYWERAAFGGKHRKSFAAYDEGPPTVWTAAFTHRWNIRAMANLAAKKDPATGLPKYLLLDRKNESSGGGYFGKHLFDYGSQNLEQEALDRLYTFAQNEFYRKLAPLYRNNPKMTIAVEPNHENEIVSGDESVGDYHPKSIEGFYHYLIDLYGNLEGINQKMHTAFSTDQFDAPRGLLRGSWDRYEQDNPLFREWVEYNRIIIYRRIAAGYRSCLMAGFPPELIKCHQIPDTYVFGSIVGISEGEQRISPIDWLLTTGAGFGFSRYGTYYHKEHNIGQGAHSSGFDGMLIGEYASLNPNRERSLEQLLYLRDHGVNALHVMWWPTKLDKGYNKAQEWALNEMIANHDTPKPGLAGGITQVRSWQHKETKYDIASLGTETHHTGLIKSLNQDGTFEGTVYVVPFHAHVDIETIRTKDKLVVTQEAQQLCQAKDIRQGSMIEVSFTIAETAPENTMQIDFLHQGIKLQNKSSNIAELQQGQKARLVYKLPLILDDMELQISSPNHLVIEDLQVVRHQDQTINLTKKIMEGKRHQGGVTFDVLHN